MKINDIVSSKILEDWCADILEAAHEEMEEDAKGTIELRRLPSIYWHIVDGGGNLSTWLDMSPYFKRGSQVRAKLAAAISAAIEDTGLSESLLDEELDEEDIEAPTPELQREWDHHAVVGEVTVALRSLEDGPLAATNKQETAIRAVDLIAKGALDSDPAVGYEFAKRLLSNLKPMLEDEGVWLYLHATWWLSSLDGMATKLFEQSGMAWREPAEIVELVSEGMSEVYNPAVALAVAAHSGGREADLRPQLIDQMSVQKEELINESMRRANGPLVAHVLDGAPYGATRREAPNVESDAPPSVEVTLRLRSAVDDLWLTDEADTYFRAVPDLSQALREIEEELVQEARDNFFDLADDDEVMTTPMHRWLVGAVRAKLVLSYLHVIKTGWSVPPDALEGIKSASAGVAITSQFVTSCESETHGIGSFAHNVVQLSHQVAEVYFGDANDVEFMSNAMRQLCLVFAAGKMLAEHYRLRGEINYAAELESAMEIL